MNFQQQYDKVLNERKAQDLYRDLPSGHSWTSDFTHNDYLGLSTHPQLITAAQNAAETFGVGGRASRLLGAESTLLCDLESLIAKTKSDNGQALVLPSGFQTNLSVVSTILNPDLLGQKPLVFSDRSIHASLHAGIRLAGARQHRFQHNDLDHLERLLQKHEESKSPRFVIVESLYSMDGDQAPLAELYQLKARYGFALYVDEAHAVGVLGPDGYGLARQNDTAADIVVGTFSKAIGATGGFVVCPPSIRNMLVNFASGFVYSTAASPVSAAAALAAWKLLPELESSREHLRQLSQVLTQGLVGTRFENPHDTSEANSHIVSIPVGDPQPALELQNRLRDAGINVACIRPPTVAAGTARLRASLSTRHSIEEVNQLVTHLSEQACQAIVPKA